VNYLSRSVVQEIGAPGIELNPLEQMSYSFRLYLNRSNLIEPADPTGQPIPFQIDLGEPVGSIAFRMQEIGLIRNADAFRLYLIYSGLDKGIQAGNYQLSPTMNAMQIANAFQDATPSELTFNILPGWRLEEIGAALKTSGLEFSQEEFMKAARRPAKALLPSSFTGLKSLEGFMLPGEYQFKRDISLDSFLVIILQRFDEQVTPEIREAFKRQGLSLQEAVALASIVERESMVTEEQPLIASVFYNRLAQGMKLESDPTVQYAVGYNEAQKTWWTNPLSTADLQHDSPYNTYLNAGLPPGPISSPSLSALQAVAYPAETPYLFFRAQCDGSGRHNFARTYEEHSKNTCP
ncbi:MAG: endolytic transglycosylase MltG, partial [Planctomycetes bacterium]|nr:endolytic transglycosylase MltG [Planctomycetota bacterium]